MKTLRTILILFLLVSPVFAAVPTIVFNSGTGSDTAASGAGPATALIGTTAAFTGSVVTLDGTPDLSGVATDGSHVLFLVTSTGRRYFTINAKDDGADTVTVDDAPAGTATGLTWAIGGKRITLNHADNRILLTTTTGAKAGWTLGWETNDTVAGSLTCVAVGDTTLAGGPINLIGIGGLRTINQTSNAAFILSSSANVPTFWHSQDLKFTNSNGTKTSANAFQINAGVFFYTRCDFGDATNYLLNGILRSASTPTITVTDCIFRSCSAVGINGIFTLNVSGSRFMLNADAMSLDTGSVVTINNNSIYGNTDDGIVVISAAGSISQNTIHGNGGDGIDTSAGVRSSLAIRNNNITGNTGRGLNAASGQVNFQFNIDYNNYGSGALANTAGAYSNVTAGANDFAEDPGYVDAAGGNFAIINEALMGVGFPSTAIGIDSATLSYVDIGAAQAEATAGGPAKLVNGKGLTQ